MILVAAALVGCGPNGMDKQDTGLVVGAAAGGILGNQVGRGSGKVLATVAGAVIGGIVGSEIGRSMDQQDRILAQQAEMNALERGRSGERIAWRNPDNGRYGDVVPGAPYRRGAVDCRDYTHTVYMNGRPQTMRGTACRNPDGTWQNVG
jgi:surface antigen